MGRNIARVWPPAPLTWWPRPEFCTVTCRTSTGRRNLIEGSLSVNLIIFSMWNDFLPSIINGSSNKTSKLYVNVDIYDWIWRFYTPYYIMGPVCIYNTQNLPIYLFRLALHYSDVAIFHISPFLPLFECRFTLFVVFTVRLSLVQFLVMYGLYIVS